MNIDLQIHGGSNEPVSNFFVTSEFRLNSDPRLNPLGSDPNLIYCHAGSKRKLCMYIFKSNIISTYDSS